MNATAYLAIGFFVGLLVAFFCERIAQSDTEDDDDGPRST